MSEFEYVLMNRRSTDELVCMDSDGIFSTDPAEVIETLQECFLSSSAVRDRYCHVVIWTDGIWSLQLHEVRNGKITGKKLYECQFTDHTHNACLSDKSYTALLAFLVERYWSTCDLGFSFFVRPLHDDDEGDLDVTPPQGHRHDDFGVGQGKRRRDV